MPAPTEPLPEAPSSPNTSGTDTHKALEADARDSIAKALWLFENGEKDVAQHMFERLAQRVRQAGPVAMLISGDASTEERADLQAVVDAIAEVAAAKPERDDEAEA